MTVWQAELARLDAAEQGLRFGRLDLRDGRRVYVGRLGLFRDDDDEPLLLDWRVPMARAFYTATANAPHGVRRRRRITTRGRTVVAWHRVAYLLCTRPHLRTRGVLVVGPGQVFLDYIGQVLPGLGENSVVTATVADLCPGIEVGRVDPPGIAERKGRAVMAEQLAAAVRSRVRTPDHPVDVEFEQQTLRLDPRTCDRAARKARRTGLPHTKPGWSFSGRPWTCSRGD